MTTTPAHPGQPLRGRKAETMTGHHASTSHTGEIVVDWPKTLRGEEQRVTVTCPYGHIVSGYTATEWIAGGHRYYPAGKIVTCRGAL